MNWNNFKDKIQSFSKQKLVSFSLLSSEAATHLAGTEWFKGLNDFSSEVSKAMDYGFIKENVTQIMTPTNHRILDGGHDFLSSISRAREIGEQNDWGSVKIFEEWAHAYFTDMSSPAGVPVFGKFSDDIYNFLKSSGVSDGQAADAVTINGQEAIESLLAGSISAVALIFAWKASDKEAFSKSIGFILVSGASAMSPAALVVAVVALAFGYNSLVCKEAVARGALTSGLTLLVSAAIPGPVLLGLVPAVVLSIYLNKKIGKNFNPIEQSVKLYELVSSKEFKDHCNSLYMELKGEAVNKMTA